MKIKNVPSNSLCTDVPPPSEKIGRRDFLSGRGDVNTQATLEQF